MAKNLFKSRKRDDSQIKRHLNIHCHPIQAFRLDNQKIIEKNIIKTFYQNIFNNFKSSSIYTLVCTQYNEFNYDYIYNYNRDIIDYPCEKKYPSSLFYTNLKLPFNDATNFEFVLFHN